MRNGSLDAFMRRLEEHEQLIVQRGSFPKTKTSDAVVSASPKTKEPIARWLRIELKGLREGEKKIGAAPVFRGEALPRAVIADLAMTMLECLYKEVGENLICLLQELLDVDRHRKSLSIKRAKKFEDAARIEARLIVQGKARGVRRFAKLLFMSPSTVIAWRRSAKYQSLVEYWKGFWLRQLPPSF
jgi:hypothetical protein